MRSGYQVRWHSRNTSLINISRNSEALDHIYIRDHSDHSDKCTSSSTLITRYSKYQILNSIWPVLNLYTSTVYVLLTQCTSNNTAIFNFTHSNRYQCTNLSIYKIISLCFCTVSCWLMVIS